MNIPESGTTTEPTLDPARGWLERLGLIGLSTIEPPLLAALVTGSPLLLIGAHGTAKSLLLTRIAAALELEFRHYNASLLNFDDLVGFPLPGKDGTLQYVHTHVDLGRLGSHLRRGESLPPGYPEQAVSDHP
jgi:MoxR-like ATPase